MLTRVFSILNSSTPEQNFARRDLFGPEVSEDVSASRAKWAHSALRVLLVQGFIGRVGAHSAVRYYRARPIPTDERMFQLCANPRATLDALVASGEMAPKVASVEPSLAVVQPSLPSVDIDEAVDEGGVDATDGDFEPVADDEDAGASVTTIDLAADFNPQAALLATVNGVNHIKARMTIIEHRLMDVQARMDDLFREWTGDGKRK